MILATKQLKEVCSTALTALDADGKGSSVSKIKETLELKAEGRNLFLNITNREYYVSVKFPLDHDETFHSTVNANTFLKLIAELTSDTVELSGQSTYLSVKANGSYKIPYIFEGDELMTLPEISVTDPDIVMNVSGEILNSILLFNSKEIQKASVSQPVQKLYYIDEKGCITFTSGATVNNFTLEKPVKLLVNDKLVKLFKLFKKDTVKFSLGHEAVSETMIQTRVSFETEQIKLTAITPSDDSLISRVPVERIRTLATKNHNNKAVVNKVSFLEALKRLALFNVNNIISVEAGEKGIQLKSGENVEKLTVENGSQLQDYTFLISLSNLQTVLETTTEQYVTVSFGDHTAVTVSKGSVVAIVPEARLR